MPVVAQARARRRAVNLSLPETLVAEAKALGVNASQAAERGLADAVRRCKEETWRRENAEAIAEYNAFVEAGHFDEFLGRF